MRKIILLAAPLVAGAVFASNGRESIPDVRVAPLLQSRWGQQSDTGYSNTGKPCFNYYTTNNYPCGCSATAMAQIVRYWEYPASAPAGEYLCAINVADTYFEIWAGVYDYANMPFDTRGEISELERQAIGKLTYDCAVALHTHFGPSGSYAYSDYAFSIFIDTFGYASAMGYCPAGIKFADIREVLFSNFDLGCPVMLDLQTDDELGHQVLADGYGFDGDTAYVHIACGWPQQSDECDRWYALPDIETRDYMFTKIDGIIYNIFPEFSGDILSGRVTDTNGNPVSNVLVKATYKTGGSTSGTAASKMAWTTDNGIYAFVLEGGKTYTVECEGQYRTVKLLKSVSAICTWSDPLMPYIPDARKTGTVGNSWGNDFLISGSSDSTPTLDPEPDPERNSGEEDPLGAFNPNKAINGAYPYCGAIYDASAQVCGTVLLKVGKPSKKKVSKVSGTIMLLDGKKYSIKSADFGINGNGPVTVKGIEVKEIGTIDLKVGANGFEASIAKTDGSAMTAMTADIAKGLSAGTATFSVEGLPETVDGHPALAECLPDGQSVAIGKKWDCGKTASLKYAKVYDKDPATGKKLKTYQWELRGLADPKKPNMSGLKLTYTAKTGMFRGSFYIYTDSGTAKKPKLKKTAASVIGFVVDGKGVGMAAIKQVGTFSVTIQ